MDRLKWVFWLKKLRAKTKIVPSGSELRDIMHHKRNTENSLSRMGREGKGRLFKGKNVPC